jgi:hypothetical protein
LVSAIGGTLTADDAVTRIENQAAQGTWSYASLIDMRAVSSWLTFDQMATVTRCAQAIAKRLGPRGPVAIVVANQALIPVGQSSAVIKHEAGMAGFFRDFDSAEAWLESEQSN